MLNKSSITKKTNSTIVQKTGKYTVNKGISNEAGLIDIIDITNLSKEGNRCQKIAFNDTGDAFVSSDAMGNIITFYLLKNRYVNICHSMTPTSLIFTEKNGGQIFFAQSDRSICIYNLGGKLIKQLKGHKFQILGLKISHIRNLLLSYSSDCCMLWDLKEFKLHKTLFAKTCGFTSALFSPDGDSLITSFQDSSIFIWNLSDFQIEEKISLPIESKINKLTTSIESTYLVATGETSYLFIYNLRLKKEYTTYRIPNGCDKVNEMLFIPRSRLVLLGNDDQIYVIELSNGFTITLKQRIPNKAIISFNVDVYGKYLACVSNTGEIYLYDFIKLLDTQQMTDTKRIGMGISPDLVYNTLKPINLNKLYEENQDGKSSLLNKSNDIDKKEDGNNKLDNTKYQSIPDNDFQNQENVEQIIIAKETLRRHSFDQKSTISKSNIQKTKKNFNNSNTKYKTKGSQSFNTSESSSMFIKSGKQDFTKSKLNTHSLRNFLKSYNIFPEKHRSIIWRSLIGLPMNQEAFDNLMSKGIHIAFEDLNKLYPIKSNNLYVKVQRILSCLAWYCPLFAEIEYLPAMIFPFVKLFSNDELLCFECIISFCLQWGQHFFEFFPNAPINLLQAIDELLKYHDNELYEHLKQAGFSIVKQTWPLLQIMFTDILNRQDWLSLMDFLVCYNDEPSYLLYFVVAYFSYFKPALLKVMTLEDIEFFLKKQNAVNIKQIIENMQALQKRTPSSAMIIAFKNNLPLTPNQYPIYNFYPKFTVDYQNKIKEDLYNEEKKIENRKQQIQQIQALTDQLLLQEVKFKDQQEALVRAEKERKEMLLYEEEMRLQKRMKMENQARERRLAQLKNLEMTVKNSLSSYGQLREEEFKEFEKELEAKKKIENHILQSKLEEEALLNLEFQAAQRLNEMIELRNREERMRKLRIEMDFREKQQKMKDRLFEESMKAEDEEFRLRMNALRQQKIREYNMEAENNEKKELEFKLALEEFQKELRLKDIERERRLRRLAEMETIKNEEFMKLYKKQEELLEEEDKRHIAHLLDEERKNAIRRAEERLAILEQEKRMQAAELDKYRERLKEISNNQKRDEFEQKILEIRRENERKMLEEERKLQKTILEIEEERKFQREMQQELLFKQREYQEKAEFHRALKDEEEKIINEERRNFLEFKEALKDEFSKVEEVRTKMNEARMLELAQQREEALKQRGEEIRKQTQAENMRRYMEEEDNNMRHRKNNEYENYENDDDEEEEEESSSSSSSNVNNTSHKLGDNRRLRDYRTDEDKLPENYKYMQSSNKQQQYNHQKRTNTASISSYTYSDTANEDNNTRSRSSKLDRSSSNNKNHHVNEAEEILNRHQITRSIGLDKDYKDNKTSYTPLNLYANIMPLSSSQESKSGDFIKGQIRNQEEYLKSKYQSSPDNLTYSSGEGSPIKDDRISPDHRFRSNY